MITLDEAIEILSRPKTMKGTPQDILEAHNMAITALRQLEIIRCRECKYAEVADKEDSQDGYTCQFHRGSIWFGGSYCSWAERREVDDGNTD